MVVAGEALVLVLVGVPELASAPSTCRRSSSSRRRVDFVPELDLVLGVDFAVGLACAPGLELATEGAEPLAIGAPLFTTGAGVEPPLLGAAAPELLAGADV